MQVQIVEQIELFSEAELENLEFVPEELEAIEAERVPNLDSITFEDIAEALEAALEQHSEALLERMSPGNIPHRLINQLRKHRPSSRQSPRPRPRPRARHRHPATPPRPLTSPRQPPRSPRRR